MGRGNDRLGKRKVGGPKSTRKVIPGGLGKGVVLGRSGLDS